MSKNLYLERGSEELEKGLEKEREKREKKKRRRHKVSGRGVFKLREILSKKSSD